MKIHCVSDIHNEFGELKYTPPECDVVICAGDIHPGVLGLMWAAETFPNLPVIYIPGNHEFWGKRRLHRHIERMQAKAKDLGIHFLYNNEVIIGNVRFLGCTLWTDLNLMGDQPLALIRASTEINDYQQIYSGINKRLQPYHTLREHEQSLNFLTESFDKPFDGKTVVVTHHAPSEQSCFPNFRGNPSNYCYASNLDRFVEIMEPELWCHGHVHHSKDYVIGNTRIICNPRGYDNYELNSDFDTQLVIEI